MYKALAHPEQNGYVTPYSLKERLMHVAEADRKLGSRFRWLVDSMDNDLKHALGNAPNSEFVIDPAGRIVVARSWSKPDELRADLARLVGEVTPATTIDEVGMQPLQPAETVAQGIVPRIELPGQMVPVIVQPVGSDSEIPYYVKLRAELSANYSQNHDGQLYLGFFMDPLYHVHWNNEVPPISYRIDAPEGLSVTPLRGSGPVVEQKADADPREFLVSLSGRPTGTLRITIDYFACDDDETFCLPVTQQFDVTLERDRDGGSRRVPGRQNAGTAARMNRPGAGRPLTQDARRAEMLLFRSLFMTLDRNRDRQITPDEIESAPHVLKKLDRNADGQLTDDEIRSALGR